MKHFTLFLALLISGLLNAQVGATAPDFTIEDIDGVEHNLYDILDDGKVVVIDCSATWCNPCWQFHQAHFLNDLNEQFGPEGTDQIRVIFYEADAATTSADLNGTGSNTYGDWVTGSTYPIVDESTLSLSANIYWPLGFPTINVINPETKVIDADLWDPWSQNQGNDPAALAAMIEIIEDAFPSSVGIEEVDAFQSNVYPNPSNGEFTVDFVSLEGEQVSVEILTVTGQLISSQILATQTGANTLKINLENVESGNYLMRISDNLNTTNKSISIF